MRRLRLPSICVVVAAAACTPQVQGPPPPPSPLLEDFQECTTNAQCASDACSRRRCVPNDCDVDDDCAGDSVCAKSNLLGNVCADAAARGDECFTWDDTGDRSTRTCAVGLECVDPGIVGFAGASICVPPSGPRLVREPCDEDHPCGDSLSCDGVCLGDVGVACRDFADCDSRLCSETSGACVANECGGAGELCAEDLFCMNAECGRKCLPLVGAGDVCRTEDACGDVLFCASGDVCGVDGTCP